MKKAQRSSGLMVEQLESREVPAPLVASSFFDGGLYAIDSDTGALTSTLVAPGSSPLLTNPLGMAVGPDGNLYFTNRNLMNPSAGSVVKYDTLQQARSRHSSPLRALRPRESRSARTATST